MSEPQMNRPLTNGSVVTLAAVLLALVAVVGAGALVLTGDSGEPEAVKPALQRGGVVPPTEPSRPPTSDDRPARDRSYLQEERCQPIDDMNDPEDGVIPSPEELFPDPEKCPEFFEGRPGGQSGAPPVAGAPVVPAPSPSPAPSQSPYRPCSETASLNGFPCTNTPNGPAYITPDPSGPD